MPWQAPGHADTLRTELVIAGVDAFWVNTLGSPQPGREEGSLERLRGWGAELETILGEWRGSEIADPEALRSLEQQKERFQWIRRRVADAPRGGEEGTAGSAVSAPARSGW